MTLRKCIILVWLASTCLTFSGCGGGGAELRSTSTTTTIGQELIDLQKAREMGIITEDEYEDAKENILDRE